jgi:hypothetical protein
LVGLGYTDQDMEYENDPQLTIIYEPISPMEVGTSIQDDTEFIQKCIDANVQPPPGYYRITKEIVVKKPDLGTPLREA